ncbi:hypothetical protein BDV96DRAFT_606286 [Lophiotrema nucula]|uniref:SRR1-like domain-containing protein n=1 Tax=Lophiotrema nucula TaxID=690887 RepID=A0A6A5YNH1_9PLEO|nr:hypothetical protein BDV96DRAFT_606286 [Lophiotrema nucula]
MDPKVTEAPESVDPSMVPHPEAIDTRKVFDPKIIDELKDLDLHKADDLEKALRYGGKHNIDYTIAISKYYGKDHPVWGFKEIHKKLSGKPYHSDESLQKAIKMVTELNTYSLGTRVTLKYVNMFGEPSEQHVVIGEDDFEPGFIGVAVQNYFASAEFVARPLQHLRTKFPFCPFYPGWVPPTYKAGSGATQENKAWVKEREEVWKSSEYPKQIESFFQTHGSKLSQVTKVICMGLGAFCRPVRSDDPIKEIRFKMHDCAMAQHLGALEVRERIAQCQGKEAEDIELLAQDPAYTGFCISILTKRGFRVLDTQQGEAFTRIDQKSFNISIGEGLLQQCYVGLGGGDAPAGLWMDVRCEDTEAEKDKYQIPEDIPFGTTSAMIKYRNRCLRHEFNVDESDESEKWFEGTEFLIKLDDPNSELSKGEAT